MTTLTIASARLRRFTCVAFLAMTSALPVASTTPERSTIAEHYKWDLGKMYASPEKWDEHYQQVGSLVTEFAAKKGTTGESAKSLLAALQMQDQLSVQLEKLHAYAAMKRDEDMRVPAAQALYQRAQTLSVKWNEESAWFQPELLRIPETQLRGWLEGADLKVYQHYFDDLLRTKAHILSAREEELLAMSGKATGASSDAFGLLSNTELRWRTVKDAENRDIEITSSSVSQAMQSKDRRYRHDAFLALHNSFLDVKSTLAATLAGTMQKDWFYSKARGYPTCLHRALDAENLPLGVYDNLVKTVNDHVALLHRYLALKKQVLKVAGVDMTSPKPIEDAMALFEQLLKELEQLLKS